MQLQNSTFQPSSTVQPKKGHQSDKYQGGIHTVSKLRHGKGTYSYDNSFFSFQGNYLNGKKNGPGTIKFKDGRVMNVNFQDDQMVGQAEIIYPDGGKYTGSLKFGEKQGEGVYESSFESYKGQWKDNCKHGKGIYNNRSNGERYEGEFKMNKPHGDGHLTKWNYEYEGSYVQGLKNGEGREINNWMRQEGKEDMVGRYEYQGEFKDDRFEGKGVYKSRQSKYTYTGDFTQGKPNLYPNEFRCFLSINLKNGQQTAQGQKTLLNLQPIQYQLQGDSFNLYIESVYQGPQVLDQVQPTQEQIDLMIKNWQNENKKNKNPPPMPDFNQPRMKKPQMVVVQQENGRCIQLKLIREADGKEECMKIDYRNQILAKRKENQQLRQQALKKAQEEGNKKGGKKDNKGETELKVNLFKDHPTSKEKLLRVLSEAGRCQVLKMEFPDDFPAGKYWLQIGSPFCDFGRVKAMKRELLVKAKQVKKK